MRQRQIGSYAAIAFGALLVFAGIINFMFTSGEYAFAMPALVATAINTPDATPTNTIPLPSSVSGFVMDTTGPMVGATVQIQGTPHRKVTGSDGSFYFSGISGTTPITLTAWGTGHYVGWTVLNPSAPDWTGGTGIKIMVRLLPETDNPQYDWATTNGVHGSASCGLCHREYQEWQADAHSHAATNIHFLTTYTGADATGDAGQPTQYDDKGNPLPPDPSKPYYGPGFLLDSPGRAGNCATCHTPMAGKISNQQNCAWSGCHTNLTIERANGRIDTPVRPVNLHGDALEGISCEFCHKIGDVIIDPKTNLPFPDMPGILSLHMFRPKDDSQNVLFGTLVDVTRPDSYLPLLSQSQFCAGCHYGVFGGVVGMGDVKDGTVIYNSYGEWLNSKYSDPKTGETCQQCHMPPADANYTVSAAMGGISRDYTLLHFHTMPSAADANLMQNAVTMKSEAQRNGNQVQVRVDITNDKTGHDVPTDAPIRSVILVVEAVDANGTVLALSAGPVNPTYSGNYGGLPGKTFAKILKDTGTGEMPTGAFWRPVTIVADNRLVPMATDTSNYTFDVSADKAVTINVKLVYRRAFAEMMKQKGWTDPDVLMASVSLNVLSN